MSWWRQRVRPMPVFRSRGTAGAVLLVEYGGSFMAVASNAARVPALGGTHAPPWYVQQP
jgi:hypothetical protein